MGACPQYFAYDEDGNTLHIQEPAGTTYFAYNGRNTIKQIQFASGTVTRLGYDATGKLAWKDVDGTPTYFGYDGLDVLVERNAAGVTVGEYTYGESVVPAIGNLAEAEVDGARYIPVFNHVGDLVAVLDANGAVVYRCWYDAFGRVLGETGTNPLPFGHHGPCQMKRAGAAGDPVFYLPQAGRLLWPEVGRYLGSDEINGSYRYCYANPVRYLDPTGFYGIDVHFYMTYYLAYACGFTAKTAYTGVEQEKGRAHYNEAYIIAWADQFTDVHPKTRPVNEYGSVPPDQFAKAKEARAKFHFREATLAEMSNRIGELRKRHRDQNAQQLRERIEEELKRRRTRVLSDTQTARAPLERAISQKSLMGVGIGLHAFQDSWAHELFGSAKGHMDAEPESGAPDWPWHRPKVALRMAERTHEMLGSFMRKLHGRACAKPWGEVKRVVEEGIACATLPEKAKKKEEKRAEFWQKLIRRELGHPVLYGDDSPTGVWAKDFLEFARTVGATVPRWR